MTPSLVPRTILVKAFAQRSIAFQLSVIGGPALGGLLFAVAPRARLRRRVRVLARRARGVVLACTRAATAPARDRPDLASVLGGVRLVRRTPVLLGAISLDLFAVLFGGAVALLPVFARDVLDVGPAGLGVLRAAPAVGALCAAIVVLARGPCAATPAGRC